MNFKKWVKSIQTAGYNGAHTVSIKIRAILSVDYGKVKKKVRPFFRKIREACKKFCCYVNLILSMAVRSVTHYWLKYLFSKNLTYRNLTRFFKKMSYLEDLAKSFDVFAKVPKQIPSRVQAPPTLSSPSPGYVQGHLCSHGSTCGVLWRLPAFECECRSARPNLPKHHSRHPSIVQWWQHLKLRF